jgi:hypothetical protein
MATNDKLTNISSFQQEGRVFKPSKEFSQKAHIKSSGKVSPPQVW